MQWNLDPFIPNQMSPAIILRAACHLFDFQEESDSQPRSFNTQSLKIYTVLNKDSGQSPAPFSFSSLSS